MLKTSLLFIFFAGSMISAAAQSQEGNWIVLAVNANATADRTAYVSQPIYYPGYTKCGNTDGNIFESRVKRRFENYLESRFPKSFPSSIGNYMVHSLQDFGDTAMRNHSRGAVEDRANAFAAEEQSDNKRVIFTNFAASGCDRD